MASHALELSGEVDFGPVKAPMSIDFSSGTPTVLVINVPGVLKISALVDKFFGGTFPGDVFDVSFSNLLLYYAWSVSVKPPSDQRVTAYSAGFHGESGANVYGIDFLFKLNILAGDKNADGTIIDDTRGVVIEGTKKTPVEVIGITLSDKADKTRGPSFGLSTLPGKTYCYVEASVAFFGTDIGSIKLTYDSKNGFSGKVDVKADFFPGGHASITFELVQTSQGKHRLRISELPAVFDDIIKAEEIVEKIEKLSAADGECGPITLVFQDQFKSTLNVKVKIPDSDGQSPDKGILNGATHLSLEVSVQLDFSVAGHQVAEIELGSFPLEIDIPKDLSSLGISVVDSLTRMAGTFIEGLWTDKEKFQILLGLIASNLLTGKTLSSLVCRKQYKPKSKSNPDQEPEKGDDGGGTDGDGAAGGTGGSGAAAAAHAAGAAGATLASTILALLSSGKISSNKSSSPEPQRVDGPPPTPSSDPLGQAIGSAINKNFSRWKDAKDYKAAIQTVLACALEYRGAIAILRKVLQSDEVAPRLEKSVYDDYKKRLPMLIYDFSMLSTRFSERWLDISKMTSGAGTYLVDDSHRHVDVSWNPEQVDESVVTALTVHIDGELKAKLQPYANNYAEFIIPELTEGSLQVHYQIDIVAAIWNDDRTYAFYSQGKPAIGDY